ncbi:hypothetical protein D9M69_670250 [compost metagenome]
MAKKNADDFFGAFARQLTGEAVPRAEVVVRPVAVAPSGVPVAVSPGGATGGGLGAPVPAWLVVFGTALGVALGYCIGLLAR